MPRCLERGRARDGAALRGVIFCATQPEEGRECSGLFEAWRGPGCGGDGVGGERAVVMSLSLCCRESVRRRTAVLSDGDSALMCHSGR